MEERTMEDQTTEEQETEKQEMEERITEERTTEEQETEKQEMEERTMEEQATKEQAMEDQATADQATEEQEMAYQAMEDQATADQSMAYQTMEDQSMAYQTTEGQATADQATEEQEMADQSMAGQATEGQEMADQAMEGQATEDQTTEGQEMEYQSMADQTTEEQEMADQSMEGQAMEDQATEEQVIEEQAVDMEDINLTGVYLNYNTREDEAYAVPIKDMLLREKIDFAFGKEKGEVEDQDFNFKMIVNLITEEFFADEDCRKVAELAYQSEKRIVSIIFSKKEEVKNKIEEMGEQIGETLYFTEVYGELEEYLMSGLYSEAPFSDYLGDFGNNRFCEMAVKPVMKGAIIPPNMVIGNDNSVILAIGSTGYSTLKLFNDQGFEIKSRVIMVLKNKSVQYGQPQFGLHTTQWYINIENENKDCSSTFLNNIKEQIHYILQEEVGSKDLILIGGLGKATASFLLPLIVNEANRLAINTVTVCTLPFKFESKNIHQIAIRGFDILKKIADNIFYYDSKNEGQVFVEEVNLQNMFNVLSFAMAVAINTGLEDSSKRKGKIHRILITKRTGTRSEKIVKQEAYGSFGVAIAQD